MEELYKQNVKIVYHFLFARCKDATLTEELLQDTFLKAFESMERFDGSCKLSTWLCQIARYLLYQHWEKEKKASFAELTEARAFFEECRTVCGLVLWGVKKVRKK